MTNVDKKSLSEERKQELQAAYIETGRELTESERLENIALFDQFILRRVDLMIALRREKNERPTRTGMGRIKHKAENIVAQVDIWLKETSDELARSKVERLQELIDEATFVRNTVISTPNSSGNYEKWKVDAGKRYRRDPNLLKLKRQKDSLQSLVNHWVPKLLQGEVMMALKSSLVEATSSYDSEVCYSAYGEFDHVFEEFIRCDDELCALVNPTAEIIIDGTSKALLSTLSELNIAVLGKMNIQAEMAKVIVYTSLVRLVFNAAYANCPSILEGTLEENDKFTRACYKYAQQTVRELGLSDAITKNYTQGLHVVSLFRAKQVDLMQPIELMTNPIDIIMHVHHILGKLATYFASNEGFISFDDTLTLLLALLSISPPVNAIAISKFLTKWACVQISSLVNVAMNYYLAAVEQMELFSKGNTE